METGGPGGGIGSGGAAGSAGLGSGGGSDIAGLSSPSGFDLSGISAQLGVSPTGGGLPEPYGKSSSVSVGDVIGVLSPGVGAAADAVFGSAPTTNQYAGVPDITGTATPTPNPASHTDYAGGGVQMLAGLLGPLGIPVGLGLREIADYLQGIPSPLDKVLGSLGGVSSSTSANSPSSGGLGVGDTQGFPLATQATQSALTALGA